MMSDPERIMNGTSTGELDSFERDLLSSVGPSSEQREKVFGGVLTQAGMAAGAAAILTHGSGAATKGAGAGAATKGAGAGAALGAKGALATTSVKLGLLAFVGTPLVAAGVMLGGTLSSGATGSSPDTSQGTNAQAIAAPVDAPKREDKAGDETASEPPAVIENDAAPQLATPAVEEARSVPKKATQESALVLENRLFRQAKTQLKAGATKSASQTLARLDRKFPNGVLMQEREVLRINLLKSSGKAKEAAEHSNQFKKSYPNSPYED